MSLLALLFVALGGATGAVTRYATAELAAQVLGRTWVPAATLLVNVIGCLIIGIVAARSGRSEASWIIDNKPLIAVGFCGALTTFSTFGLETLDMLQRRPVLAVALVAAHVVLGVAAVAVGFKLAAA